MAASVCLAGCATLGPTPDTGDAPPPRYGNIGRTHAPEATLADWVVHLARMATGAYPGPEALPRDHVLPEAEARRQFIAAGPAPVSLTWFGHSTFLLRIDGRAILTDPQLMDAVGTGPFRLRRMVPVLPDPGLIERLDAIVVSHADFDHLDLPSLRLLAARFPDATLYVPEGTGRLARLSGFTKTVEMPWYGRARVGGVRITAVPAVHGIRRPPFAADSMHWAGYVIEGAGRRVYFSGDTGAGSVFADMRARIGAVDYAIVPAGAWAPHDFQAPYHADPKEAVEIAATLGARLAIGMHWGTLPLSPESGSEQRDEFLAAGTRTTPTTVFRIGETRMLR